MQRPLSPAAWRFAARITRITSCFIVFCAVTLSARAEPIQLKLKPAKGDVQRMKVTSDQKITQTIDGKPVEMTQTLSLGYTLTTGDVTADGVATVKVSYDSVTFKHQSAMGLVEYDSAAPPPAQLHPMVKGFAALAGQSFTMKITPTGRVTQATGLDGMVDAILKKLDIPEGPSKAAAEKSIRAQFGEDAIRESMETLLAIYPDKPVSIGDSWIRKVTVTRGLPITSENVFTLKTVGDGIATLDVKGKLGSNPDAPPLDMGQLKVSYNLSGEQTGTMKLNSETGWVKAADFVQKLGGEVKQDAGAGRVTNRPFNIETRMTVESK